ISLICPIICTLAIWVILAGNGLAERLPIKTYTTADGLARDTINRIVQDSKGFLWFFTTERLSRFDGYKFTNYGTDDGLAGRQVYGFLEARNGFYWVATNKGLCRFIPDAKPAQAARTPTQRFVVYNTGETQQSRNINAIYEDHRGTIWCCTWQGLYRGDQVGSDTVFSLVDILEHGTDRAAPQRVDTVIEDRGGSLWIIAFSGVYRVPPNGAIERYAVEEGLPDATMLEGRDGLIWVASRTGLYQFVRDPKPHHSIVARRYTVKDGLAAVNVSSLCQSSDGTLWIGTSLGLSRLVRAQSEGSGRFQSYTEANGISGVTALCEDRDHNLWIGTLSKGAMRLAASGFVTYNEADGLGGIGPDGVRVSSIFENQAHELCVLTSHKDFISKFERGRFTAVPLTLPHGMFYWGWGWYQLMFQDRSGEWWMTTGQGLVRYPRLTSIQQITHARPTAIYKTRDGLGSDEVFRRS